MIRIGCSGWNYATWRNEFYPQGVPASRWLEHYSRVFDTVEVNSTFYRLPRRDAVARWVTQTPEDRHESWFSPDVLALLREHEVALTIADRPEMSFQTHDITSDFTFVRLHYGHRGRRGNYSDTELMQWSQRIVDWARGGPDVHAYFNNDWEVFAPRNARKLRRMVERLDPALLT